MAAKPVQTGTCCRDALPTRGPPRPNGFKNRKTILAMVETGLTEGMREIHFGDMATAWGHLR